MYSKRGSDTRYLSMSLGEESFRCRNMVAERGGHTKGEGREGVCGGGIGRAGVVAREAGSGVLQVLHGIRPLGGRGGVQAAGAQHGGGDQAQGLPLAFGALALHLHQLAAEAVVRLPLVLHGELYTSAVGSGGRGVHTCSWYCLEM